MEDSRRELISPLDRSQSARLVVPRATLADGRPGVSSRGKTMRAAILATAVLGLVGPAVGDEPTKATFLVTGLHCPPCTTTVQSSLARVKGVKSVTVDWNTKNAKVQFDESVLPAQALAAAI